MAADAPPPTPGRSAAGRSTREERLAAELRANLKRRKAQARALTARSPAPPPAAPLSKPRPPG